MTKQERRYYDEQTRVLRPEILASFGILGIKGCNRCGKSGKIEIHHKRYELNIGLRDLELLCHVCHNEQTQADKKVGNVAHVVG